MGMTRKDFNRIADALKECHEAFEGAPKQVHEALDRATREIATVCYASNGSFDRQRFHSAAGYGTGNRDRAIIDPNCLGCIDAMNDSLICTVCGERVWPDSQYACGYRHSSPALHGAAPRSRMGHAVDCVARG